MPRWAPPDWRDADAYAMVRALGRSALAWELLRRDPAYRRSVMRTGMSGNGIARWGLHFPG